MLKGIQLMKNGKYRVQKHGTHLGIYLTLEEAEGIVIEADKLHKETKASQPRQKRGAYPRVHDNVCTYCGKSFKSANPPRDGNNFCITIHAVYHWREAKKANFM